MTRCDWCFSKKPTGITISAVSPASPVPELLELSTLQLLDHCFGGVDVDVPNKIGQTPLMKVGCPELDGDA